MKARFCLPLVLLALLPALVVARETREQQRIDYLLQTVASSQGIKFIRNGSEYDGATAAKHLRGKLDYAGDRLKTAEQFIQYCASESSFTHRKYTIRLPDGITQDSAAYFTGLLHQFDAGHQ